MGIIHATHPKSAVKGSDTIKNYQTVTLYYKCTLATSVFL